MSFLQQGPLKPRKRHLFCASWCIDYAIQLIQVVLAFFSLSIRGFGHLQNKNLLNNEKYYIRAHEGLKEQWYSKFEQVAREACMLSVRPLNKFQLFFSNSKIPTKQNNRDFQKNPFYKIRDKGFVKYLTIPCDQHQKKLGNFSKLMEITIFQSFI